MVDAAGKRASFAELEASGVLLFSDGYRTKKSELGATGFPILRVSQIGDGRIIPERDLDYVSEEHATKIGPKTAEVGDAIVTTKGTVGRRARVREGDQVYVYSPQVCFFRVGIHFVSIPTISTIGLAVGRS